MWSASRKIHQTVNNIILNPKILITKSKKLLFRLAVLVAAMVCALRVSAQEAYAWYSPGANSLTFCYDNERSICVGTTYDLNDGAVEPGWITDGNNAYVKHVAFTTRSPISARRRPTTGSTKCVTLKPLLG